jgi:membrane peptidoglycan carboxypeptidase
MQAKRTHGNHSACCRRSADQPTAGARLGTFNAGSTIDAKNATKLFTGGQPVSPSGKINEIYISYKYEAKKWAG